MARNAIQFQKGYSLAQFMEEYGAETSAGRHCFIGVGRTGSFVPDANILVTGVFQAERYISAEPADIRSR